MHAYIVHVAKLYNRKTTLPVKKREELWSLPSDSSDDVAIHPKVCIAYSHTRKVQLQEWLCIYFPKKRHRLSAPHCLQIVKALAKGWCFGMSIEGISYYPLLLL